MKFRRTKIVRKVPLSFLYTVEYLNAKTRGSKWATGLVKVPYGGNITSCIQESMTEGKEAYSLKIIMLVEVNKR